MAQRNPALALRCARPLSSQWWLLYFLSNSAWRYVQLIFNEIDLEEWPDNSQPAIAENQRFTLKGAVALPSVYTQAKALLDAHKSNFVLGKEQGLQIHIDDQKIRLGSANVSEALTIASKVREELDLIKSAFNGHTHIFVPQKAVLRQLARCPLWLQ